MQRPEIWLLGVLTLLLGACGNGSSDSSVPAGNTPPGIFSISAYPYTDPPPASTAETIQRLIDATTLARSAGANGQFSSFQWSELEPNLNQYAADKLQNFRDAMQYAEANHLQLLVGFQMINTVTREVPAELSTVAWDDVAMIDQFKALLDQLIPYMGAGVRYISLGNEVDPYFDNGRSSEIPGFHIFVNTIQAYLHTQLPNVKVGVTVTAGGWLGSNVQTWLNLTADTEAMIITYYPLNSDFTVQDPIAPAAAFPDLVQLAGDRDVVLQEVGYPTSSLLNSSEAKQAEFIHQVFAAWRDSGQRIEFLNLFLLHDFSSDLVSALTTYYGISDPKFVAFLATLGLRNADNTDKAAWPAVLQEAADSHLR